MKIKQYIKNVKLGVDKVNTLKTLPNKWDTFHNHKLIRVIRVALGIITIIGLINLNKPIINTHGYDTYISIIVLCNFIYMTSVSLTRIIYIVKILYNKEYEVRNSPINHIASKVGSIWLCIKGTCEVIALTGGVFGTMVLMDNVLERTGRNRLLMPHVENNIDKILTTIGIEKKKIFPELSEEIESVKKIKMEIEELRGLISSLDNKEEKDFIEIFREDSKKELIKKLERLTKETDRLNKVYEGIINKRNK